MRKAMLLIGILAIAGVTAAFVIRRNQPEWTTSCPEALVEFREGLADEMKLYGADARKHYLRASQLDPDFLIAKIKYLDSEKPSKENLARITALVQNAKLDSLNAREQLLVAQGRLVLARQNEKADQLIDSYLADNPRDAFVLNMRCDRLWKKRDLTAAQQCYQKLIETDPNWVEAQNRLGYIAMAQARFKEAEDALKTYRYIAPDQANPHDSLGELLTLVGRYDEAIQEFNQAVKVRPDFCASYRHIVVAALLDDRPDLAADAVTRGNRVASCAGDLASQNCEIDSWQAAFAGDWEKVLAVTAACPHGEESVLRHLALVRLGRLDDAAALLQRVQAGRKTYDAQVQNVDLDSELPHLEGERLLATGEPAAAADKFRIADSRMLFWGEGQGIFKLYNLLRLADSLDRAGKQAEGAATLRKVNEINPNFARKFALAGAPR